MSPLRMPRRRLFDGRGELVGVDEVTIAIGGDGESVGDVDAQGNELAKEFSE